MILIALLAGTFLRLYNIWNNYFFTGELGRELLYVWQLIQTGKFPLVGLGTSHEWLNYGPIYYWILIPLVKIFGWSPFILFWLALAVSMIGILITYFVFKNIVDKKFALILSFFVSVSPIWVWATRLSKLHTFFFILTPLLIYFLYKVWNGKNKYIFWLGFSLGALFSFHYSQLPLFAVIFLAFWLKRKNLKIKNYLMFLAGLVIPNITVLIYDAKNGFSMIKNLILWIPYRFAGFTGIYPKNNLNEVSGIGTITSFNEFFGRNLFDNSHLWILGSAIFIILFIIFFVQNRKRFSKDFLTFYIISSTIVQCFALLIHTSPPLHYFFPIFLNFGLLFAYFTCQYWNKKSTRILTVAIFVLMFAAGIVGMKNEHANDPDYVPLVNQENVVEDIVKDANAQPFSLERVGPFDYFPEYYDQNYRFLILSGGGKIDPTSKLKFIILEAGQNVYAIKNVEN